MGKHIFRFPDSTSEKFVLQRFRDFKQPFYEHILQLHSKLRNWNFRKGMEVVDSTINYNFVFLLNQQKIWVENKELTYKLLAWNYVQTQFFSNYSVTEI